MTKQQPSIDWPRVARLLLTSRLLDELEERELAPAGRVAYQFSAKGHELSQILLALQLTHPHDASTVYYRSRPFMLASGWTLKDALAAGMAKAGSASEGREVGVMFSHKPGESGSNLTVFPTSGDVGAQYSPAAGWAQAIQYRRDALRDREWENAIATAHGGEGSTAANGFWAALNIAATRKIPLLFFIEDNAFAISVRSQLQTPGADISSNLGGFKNLLIVDGDGADPEDAPRKIAEAVAHVRAGRGACLLHLRVPRLMGHTFIDDQAYKTDAEKSEEQKRDPLLRLKNFLPHLDWAALERDAAAEVRAAVDEAASLPDPEPRSVFSHVFAPDAPRAATSTPAADGARVNLIDAVRRTLEVEMTRDPRILVFGEDVGAKGGVHGATAHMQEKFGETRVFDTSLSEDGIIGSAVGMAFAGLRPVPEIQFRKYADPATEQINDLGTIRWRSAGRFSAPVVIRIPVGFAKKIGDPWHSVTGEAIYAHTIGLRLAFPSNAADAAGLLRTALRGDDPVIFFEHRALLDTAIARRPYPGDEYMIPFGEAAVLAEGSALTVVAWGAMTHRVVEAAQSAAGSVEIIDLRTIVPWDKSRVLESVRKTGKCLIVHEDGLTGGFGAEIAAVIAEEAFTDLDAPLARIAVPDVPIPYNMGLMNAALPQAADIERKIQSMLAY
ncbi:MAG TPA: transketolase C-terminal domain-containing protein [Anaerolineales bacterium]|nr:transketolase C-terminal domain-containing protein [Anaerolineales bacterium]